ncbi:hypothetical protein [Rhizobium sp. LjRoot254]
MTKSFVTIGFQQRGRSLVADQPRLSKTAEIAVDPCETTFGKQGWHGGV